MQQIPNMSELLKIAQSPAGQQLMALLQKSSGNSLQNAVTQASAGDYESAKKMLAPLLDSPEVKALLKQLEESK